MLNLWLAACLNYYMEPNIDKKHDGFMVIKQLLFYFTSSKVSFLIYQSDL